MERGGDDMQQRSPAHEFISILVKRCGQTTSWKNENINTVFVREKPILELIVFDSFKIRKLNHLEKKKKVFGSNYGSFTYHYCALTSIENELSLYSLFI